MMARIDQYTSHPNAKLLMIHLILLSLHRVFYADAFLTRSRSDVKQSSLRYPPALHSPVVSIGILGSSHVSATPDLFTIHDHVDGEAEEEVLANMWAEKERRDLLANVPLFADLNAGDIARLATLGTPLNVKAGHDIIHQGDFSDSAFLVLSGSFECYDRSDKDVTISYCRHGDLFGELGTLLDQSRALSVRACANSGGIVLKLDKEDLNTALSSTKGGVETILQNEYESFFYSKKRADALKKCLLFKGLSPDDFNRIEAALEPKKYKKDDILFLQGDSGDAMYFVKSGDFGCIDEEQPSRSVVANIKAGGYFGELAILLNQKRALTVQAMKDGEVWCLSKENFISCIQESGLFDLAIESIKKAYGLRSIWDIVTTLSPGEVTNLAVTISRPKKATVSKHSTLATIATGFYLAALLPILSPGVFTNGIPRIYDQMLFDNAQLSRITTFLLAAVGVTGTFRLPPRTTPIRRLLFQQGAWISVFAWMTQDSNFYIGSGHYTFDLMQTVPALAYLVVAAMVMINSNQCVVAIISGPTKALESSLYGSKLTQVLAQTAISLGMTFVFPMAIFFRDPTVFESVYVPGINAARGVELTSPLIISGLIGFGMLIATLLFEKKISRRQAQGYFLLDFFMSGFYDTFVPIFDPNVYNMPEEGQLQHYLQQNDLVSRGYNDFHAGGFVLGLIVISIVIGQLKLVHEHGLQERETPQ